MEPCNGSLATNSAVKVPVVSLPTTTNTANRSKALALYNGNTNSLKSAYKQKLKLYEEYEGHKQDTNKAMAVESWAKQLLFQDNGDNGENEETRIEKKTGISRQ